MIVVTGGAGFIGSNVVAKLNELGHSNIVIVDHLGTTDKWNNMNGLNFYDYFDKDQFLDLVIEANLPFTVDSIIHLGACSSTTEKDANYLLYNNYKYSVELAKFGLLWNARFIYASSAATYGNGELGYDDNCELEKLRPMNMYGYSKQMFDMWLVKEKLVDKVVGLKYFNVFGPNEYHKEDMRSVVHKAFEQIRDTGKVKLFRSHIDDYKDGEQKRDFIYVDDAVEKTLFFLENPSVNGLFNVGTGKARSWIDLVTSVFNSMDKPVNIEFIDMPEDIRPKYQYFTEAKMDKIEGVGYKKGSIELEEGVEDYIKNYLQKEKYKAH